MFPKTLIFMRHGLAAEPGDFRGADRDRPLTGEGIARTAEAAKVLAAFSPPTLVVSSDYVRAVQTADLVCKAVERAGAQESPTHLQTETLRPDSCFEDWLEYLKTEIAEMITPDTVLLAVSHQPVISEIFACHLGLFQPIIQFRKAAIGIIEPITPTSGRLTAYFPSKLVRGWS